MSKENTITKQELLNELEMIYNVSSKEAKKYFKTCKDYKILKKVKGKYYYDDDNELSIFEEVGNKKIKRIPLKIKIIFLIAIIAIISIIVLIELNKPYILEGTDLALNIEKTQKLEFVKNNHFKISGRSLLVISSDCSSRHFSIFL